MTADDFRDIVLALDGAAEGAHMGHPDFRANGRIFASLHSAGPLRDGEAHARRAGGAAAASTRRRFEPSAGAWGRQGCTNVKLATADKPAGRARRRGWRGRR